MSIKLYEHNQEAYDAAIDILKKTGKAVIIHPTGTGKSFIGFKYAEQNPTQKILWLTPSKYIAQTQVENLKKESGIELDNITFMTYSKLIMLDDDEMLKLNPDFIIADEHHRMGAVQWQIGAEKLFGMYRNVPRLGLSATNIRYLDNQRNMAEELFDGNIASEMTLGEAIVRNILMPPTYVISVYGYQQELKKYEDRIDRIVNTGIRDKNKRELDKLRRTLEMADGLDKVFVKHIKNKSGKYIVFCAGKESMDSIAEQAEKWFEKVNSKRHIYKITCDDPAASNDFKAFKADDSECLKLMFCIDMLNEGVHVDDIDGVILFRATVSPIVYKQQIGRALSTGKNKHPIIFDVVNNFENLYSISSIQEEINLAVSYYLSHGDGDKIVNDKFTVIDETKDSAKLFRQLEKSLLATWDIYFSEAKKYYDKYGNLRIPKGYVTESGITLGMWISTQRKIRKGSIPGNLSEGQIARLDTIGMIWDNISDIRWENGYEHAAAYYEEHGNLDVHSRYVCEDGFKLGSWISNNRSWKINNSHTGVLNHDRINRLDNIGMIWNKNNMLWEKNYIAAFEYFKEHGDLNVPAAYITPEGIRLGLWINSQKQIRAGKTKGTALTEEQIGRLDMIGMFWENKYEMQWNRAYAAAYEYYKKYGTLDIPAAYKTETGIALGKWIRRQRTNKKLNDQQKHMLDKIGMIWRIEDPWEIRYKLAKEYYDEHGNIDLPQKYVVNNVWLGKWLYMQRKNKNHLTLKQIQKLNDIGIK